MTRVILIVGGIAMLCVAVLTFLFHSKESETVKEANRIKTEPARKARLSQLENERLELDRIEQEETNKLNTNEKNEALL